MESKTLTLEQEQALTQWREDWLALGTSTEAADRHRTEAALSSMYELLERPAPSFEWVATPLELLQCSVRRSVVIAPPKFGMLFSTDPIGDSVDALRDSLGGIFVQNLCVGLKEDMGRTLRSTLTDSLGENVHASFWEPVEERVFSEVRGGLLERLSLLGERVVARVLSEAGVSAAYQPIIEQRLGMLLSCSGTTTMTVQDREGWFQLFWAFAGQQDVHWVGFYRFCEEVLGVQYDRETSRRLALWAELCHSGWWAPYERYCICADRCARPTMMNAEPPEAPSKFWGRLSGSVARSFGEVMRGARDGAR